MTTKITPSVLENTAVVAATHGTGAAIPVIVVDPQGRITGVTNTSVGIATTQITSGTLADARLPDTGATAGSYGSASRVPRIIVDAKGRATGVANIDIQIATSQITGYPTFAASATTDTTNAGNISSGTLPDARLSNAGVNSGSFGSASAVPAITVDAKGRVTAVTATNIAIASSAVSGLATSATTDTTNAGNISSGTLPDARLSNAGTSTGTFGSASVVPRIAVDAKGRVTSVTATSIAIGAGAVSGLATVATSGSYTDLSNRPSVPAAQVNSDWNATTGVAQILNKPSIPTVPTNVSSFTNDAGYVTAATGSTSGFKFQVFESSGTFTVPAGVTGIKVLVFGGGGGGTLNYFGDPAGSIVPGPGGNGGVAAAYITNLTPGTQYAVTVGSGGTVSSAGGSSSFGSFVSATGGGANPGRVTSGNYVYGPSGVGSVSTSANVIRISVVRNGELIGGGRGVDGIIDGNWTFGSGGYGGGGGGMSPGGGGVGVGVNGANGSAGDYSGFGTTAPPSPSVSTSKGGQGGVVVIW